VPVADAPVLHYRERIERVPVNAYVLAVQRLALLHSQTVARPHFYKGEQWPCFLYVAPHRGNIIRGWLMSSTLGGRAVQRLGYNVARRCTVAGEQWPLFDYSRWDEGGQSPNKVIRLSILWTLFDP